MMIYVVGIYFTQSVTDHMVESQQKGLTNKNLDTLADYFGSLFRTILTLYQAMTGGIDWDGLADPLMAEMGALMGFMFATYIAFALLALMNIVTGVFVQTALQSAQAEEDAFLTDQ